MGLLKICAKHKGLSGSAVRNAVIFFPPLLFEDDTSCTKIGVTDLKHLYVKLEKNEKCVIT
jgi:hypothetical protein